MKRTPTCITEWKKQDAEQHMQNDPVYIKKKKKTFCKHTYINVTARRKI